MLKSRATADRDDSAVTETARHFPIEVFEAFSREELLAVLSLMHRILDADRRCDVERILTELPTLFAGHSDARDACRDTHVAESAHAELPPKSESTYHLLTYFFCCLSKAQTKIDSVEVSRVASSKNTCHLSPRELTVLLWMKEGKTNWEIARILGLSERTVRFHVGSIFEKLDVTSRTQAVARALGTGLIAS